MISGCWLAHLFLVTQGTSLPVGHVWDDLEWVGGGTARLCRGFGAPPA